MLEFMNIIDVLVLAYGIYCTASSVKMKKEEKPAQWLLNDQDRMLMRRPKEFALYMFPKTMIFGILCIAYGGFALVNDYYLDNFAVAMISLAFFFAVLIWFMIVLRRGKSKYT